MATRRFRIIDALVLIAAVAVGIALSRPLASRTDFSGNSWITPTTKVVLRAWWCMQVSAPLPAALTLVVLALRMGRPRIGPRRLTRQPGAVACLTWAVVVGIRAVGFVASAVRTARAAPLMILSEGWDSDTSWTIAVNRSPAHHARGFIAGSLADTSVEAGLAIAAAWVVLAAGRRWRAEPTWVDRAGRLLGAYWVSLALLGCWWNPRILF